MANINGLTVKSLKSFSGHDGAPALQGNVYFNGKKLGFWSQDPWCGPDRFDFDENLLSDVVNKYRDSGKVPEKYKEIFSLELLIYEVTKLICLEKDYKKCVKAGYPILLVTNLYGDCNEWFISNDAVLDKKVKAVKKSYGNNKNLDIKVYKSLSDFEVTV